MKKLISIILLCFLLTGCSKEICICPQQKLTAINLTLDNYNNYLTVDKSVRGKPNHVYINVRIKFQNGWYPPRETWVDVSADGSAETEYDKVIDIEGYIIVLGE